MRIAIQEMMLPGRSLVEKLNTARRLGFQGVEFMAEGLTERVPLVAEALRQAEVSAVAVHLGRRDGCLSPLLREREDAISAMRQAMTDAVDIGAAHVLFVPHFGGPRMPDLTPYRSPIELESEMMVWLLRTVSDLAYAMGVELDMLPVNHYESYFMNRLEQTAFFRRKIKEHAHVKVAVNMFHTAMEEVDPFAALREHGRHLGYIQLADSNGMLPGQGLLDHGSLGEVLNEIGYDGWLTYATVAPDTRPFSTDDLSTSLDFVKQIGLLAR